MLTIPLFVPHRMVNWKSLWDCSAVGHRRRSRTEQPEEAEDGEGLTRVEVARNS